MVLSDHIINKDHEKILELEGKEYDIYKGIALINLEKYSDSLNYLEKSSFERAYAYYKLRKYKRALRILKKMKLEDRVIILMSQIFYKMKYFYTAYYFLSMIKIDDEIAVNLNAIRSLALGSSKLGKFSIGCKDSEDYVRMKYDVNFSIQKVVHNYQSDECRKEAEYNETFQDLDSYLNGADTSNIHIYKQYLNLTECYDNLKVMDLTRRQKKIFDLNIERSNGSKIDINEIKKCCDNFYPERIYFECHRKLKEIPINTKYLSLFRVFYLLNMKNKDKIIKILNDDINLVKYKNIINFLMGDSENISQSEIEKYICEIEDDLDN